MKAPLIDRATKLLENIEVELRHADKAGDQIGEHAADAESVTSTELARIGPKALRDDDTGRRYLHLLGQRARALRVRAMSRKAREDRGE